MAKSIATQQLEQLLKNNVQSHGPPLTAEELKVWLPHMHKESVARPVIAYINKLLTTAANRSKGLALLSYVLEQCPSSIVLENAIAWSNLCVTSPLKLGGDVEFNILGKIMEICSGVQDFDKAMISLLPKVIEMCISTTLGKCTSKNVLQCLTVCMLKYPGSTGPFKNKIESFLSKFITCELPLTTVKLAGITFHFLNQVGGPGPGGITHSNNWSSQFSKLCATLHKLYDKYFANEIEFDSYDDISTTVFKIPHDYLVNKSSTKFTYILRNVLVFINQMLINRYSAAKNIPVSQILDVIKRGLSLDVFETYDKSLEMTRFAASLSEHQIHLLKLLQSVIACLKQDLMPFSFEITKLLIDCLQRTQKDYFQSDCEYQQAVYEIFRYWIIIGKNKLNNSNLHSKLLDHIIVDISPAKSNVTLCLSDNASRKKSPKAKNRAIQQVIIAKSNESSMRDPVNLLKAREVVCVEALNTGTTLLQQVILALDLDMYKKLFETIAQHIMSVQGGKMLHPYTNPTCQEGLYKMLTSIFSQRAYCVMPVVETGVTLIMNGCTSTNNNIHLICTQGLDVLEKLCQPVCPSLDVGDMLWTTSYKFKKLKDKLSVSDPLSNNLSFENHNTNTPDYTNITPQVSMPSASSVKKVNIIDVHIIKQTKTSADTSYNSLVGAEVSQAAVPEGDEIDDDELNEEVYQNAVPESVVDDEFTEEETDTEAGRKLVTTPEYLRTKVPVYNNKDKQWNLPTEEIEAPLKSSKSLTSEGEEITDEVCLNTEPQSEVDDEFNDSEAESGMDLVIPVRFQTNVPSYNNKDNKEQEPPLKRFKSITDDSSEVDEDEMLCSFNDVLNK